MKYKLFLKTKPEYGDFSRVHAILLTDDGRMFLRYKNGEARITGGRIDSGDEDLVASLKRELREEINCEIDKCDYLGYLEAVEPESGEIEYWARMVARVSKIGVPKPDPDRARNWIYGRALVSRPEATLELSKASKFAKTNLELLKSAYQVAEEQHYFIKKANNASEVLNPESRDPAWKARWLLELPRKMCKITSNFPSKMWYFTLFVAWKMWSTG